MKKKIYVYIYVNVKNWITSCCYLLHRFFWTNTLSRKVCNPACRSSKNSMSKLSLNHLLGGNESLNPGNMYFSWKYNHIIRHFEFWEVFCLILNQKHFILCNIYNIKYTHVSVKYKYKALSSARLLVSGAKRCSIQKLITYPVI